MKKIISLKKTIKASYKDGYFVVMFKGKTPQLQYASIYPKQTNEVCKWNLLQFIQSYNTDKQYNAVSALAQQSESLKGLQEILDKRECKDSPTEQHNFTEDLEYDHSGNIIKCDYCREEQKKSIQYIIIITPIHCPEKAYCAGPFNNIQETEEFTKTITTINHKIKTTLLAINSPAEAIKAEKRVMKIT